jgi:YtkA-like
VTIFKFGRLASIVAIAVALASCGKPASPYVFSAVQSEVSMDGNAVVDVQIVHQPTGKPVENAVIFETRLDMGPDAMGEMTAPVTAKGSPSPGVYRFTIAPTMAGRWELKLSAKVQGEAETVTGSVVVTAR